MEKIYKVLHARIEKWLGKMEDALFYDDLENFKIKAFEDANLLIDLGAIDFREWTLIMDRISDTCWENRERLDELNHE